LIERACGYGPCHSHDRPRPQLHAPAIVMFV
jgi:hypothetical protein